MSIDDVVVVLEQKHGFNFSDEVVKEAKDKAAEKKSAEKAADKAEKDAAKPVDDKAAKKDS